MKKSKIFISAVLLFLSGFYAMAQHAVTGKVTDAAGEALQGVAVFVEGTSRGTLTGLNGEYSINVPQDAVLVYSMLGYSTVSKKVEGQKVIDVVLQEDFNVLDETIVVAFGTTTKEAFTGSATVVKSEDLAKRQTSNVANALVGAVPGLQMRGASGQPGGTAGAMNIRGISSISSDYAGTEPLIIVDGSPYPGSLSNLPQDDIESVTVLKDASSAALYGARGANGVILITTKRAHGNDAVVSVDMKWGVNTRLIPDYDTITDPAEYYENFYTQLNNYFLSRGQSAVTANASANRNLISLLGYNVYDVPEGQSLVGINGKVNPYASIGRKYTGADGVTYYLQPDNWRDAAYKAAFRQEYNVSATAGNDKTSFYASVGYLGDNGVIEYSGYERISARIKADYKAKKWLKLGANAAYTHSVQNSNPNMSADQFGSTNLMYYTSMIAPIYPIYVRVVDANGNVVINKDARGNDQYDYGVAATNYNGLSRAFLQTGNPLGSNRYNEDKRVGNALNGTFTADFYITPFLTANITSNVNWGLTQYKLFENPYFGNKAGVNGEVKISNSIGFRTNNIQTLTYAQEFGEHSVNVVVGHEYYDQISQFLQAKAQGSFNPDIREINAFATKMADSESYTTEYNVEGFFGSAQYNYAKKYYGSLSYRRDASSRFHPEHRWGNFWSVGGAWIISKESFMDGASGWIDQLKLKASIGQQGNDDIPGFSYIDTYSLSKATETTMSPSFRTLGNEKITWQTTTNFNAGAEFSFLGGRIAGNFDGYYKKTKDLLFWISVPESMGARGYYGNAGDIANYGVEAAFNFVPIRTSNVQWDINLNLSHNATKILKLPKEKTLDNGGFTEDGFWYKEGGPLYSTFTYAYAGVDNNPDSKTYGQALYYYDADLSNKDDPKNKTNIISKPGDSKDGTVATTANATRYTTKSGLPDLFGGFGTSLKLWDFEISANFDYQIGGEIYDFRYRYLMMPYAGAGSYLGQTYHKDWKKAWSPTNTSSNIPRWQYGDTYAAAGSDRWLTDASYLNFASFAITYNLPINRMGNLKKIISSAKVYVVGENLGFISARQGLDPRYSYSETSAMNTYSPVRTISGGVKLTF
jgi:TonB-linked SusC/RagA family outer membrane protein